MPAHFLCFFSIYHFSPDDFFVSVGHRVECNDEFTKYISIPLAELKL